jgi:hypothetical protein
MHTLHIEHAITDLTTWQAAFDRFAEQRARAGVRHQSIRHPIGDDHYVVIDLDFETAEQAAFFLDVLRDRVWSVPDNSPALIGSPQTSILRVVDRHVESPRGD